MDGQHQPQSHAGDDYRIDSKVRYSTPPGREEMSFLRNFLSAPQAIFFFQKGQNRFSHFLAFCIADFRPEKNGAPPQSDCAQNRRCKTPAKYFLIFQLFSQRVKSV